MQMSAQVLKRILIAGIVIVLVGPWLFAIHGLAGVIPQLIVLIGFAMIVGALQLGNKDQGASGAWHMLMVYMIAFIVVVLYTVIVGAIL